MNRKLVMLITLVLFLVLSLFGCGEEADTVVQSADDEITLQVTLDLKEDIGLLILDYEADGSGGSGGVSNADRSLLKHDDLLTLSVSKLAFDDSSDMKDLSLQFAIITEYCDPNYDNIYPAEYTKTLDAIYLDAAFGETYFITITGDRINGYTAVLDR